MKLGLETFADESCYIPLMSRRHTIPGPATPVPPDSETATMPLGPRPEKLSGAHVVCSKCGSHVPVEQEHACPRCAIDRAKEAGIGNLPKVMA